jgi:hypothetical protein
MGPGGDVQKDEQQNKGSAILQGQDKKSSAIMSKEETDYKIDDEDDEDKE